MHKGFVESDMEKASNWGDPEQAPTQAVSDGMYKHHMFTDGEWQNAASIVCTSVTYTDGKRYKMWY